MDGLSKSVLQGRKRLAIMQLAHTWPWRRPSRFSRLSKCVQRCARKLHQHVKPRQDSRVHVIIVSDNDMGHTVTAERFKRRVCVAVR